MRQFEPLFPGRFQRYLEPFIGSGAVYFHLWNKGRVPGDVFLFDSNDELINAYRIVRDRVGELIELLTTHRCKHDRDYYYQVRARDRRGGEIGAVERAARTIYLNKTCYNGLYRVNRKGQFNVPMGRYRNPRILDQQGLRAASRALRSAQLARRDFRSLVDIASAGDFIYFDPPYAPVSETANFTSYTAGKFGESDQEELARVFSILSHKGCLCMLSNSHTPAVLEFYRGFRIETVRANRAINSDAGGRGGIEEVVVLNY